MNSDLDARTVRSWLRDQPDESANRVIEAALAEAATTPQERSRWATVRFAFANPVVIASIVATVALVVLGGYQFLIAPNIGTPAPSAAPSSPPAVPAPSEPPVEPPPFPEDWPSGVPDPCTVLSAEELNAVVQLPGPLSGDRIGPLTGEGTLDPHEPNRVFCAYFEGRDITSPFVAGVWLTNFWIFYDLTDWPTDPQARAETVLRTGYGGVPSGAIEELMAIADRRVWASRNSFVTADDRYIYLLKLRGNWVSAHPTALRDLATTVIGNLEAAD